MLSIQAVCGLPRLRAPGIVPCNGYYRTLIGNPILEVEPTSQRGRTAAGSGRKGNEVIASATKEAFAGWLHH